MEILPFVVFLILATLIGLALLALSTLLGAKHSKVRQNDIYESGVNPVGSATRQYDIKFYLTAILFLLFDVEIVFLLPWALNYKNATNPAFIVGGFVFFMFILLVGYVFVLNTKALNWEE